MTTEAEAGAEIEVVEATGPVEPVAAPSPAPEPAVPRRSPGSPVARRVAVIVFLFVMFVTGFAVYIYGLSGVSEDRVQNTMYKTFAGVLNQAIAPTRTGTEGGPVAVLNIPRIGISDLVVVEGTSSRDLTRGPGHVVASALPGQAGVSVLYGKVATFGAPFAHLERLNRGDRITVTTGQGTALYTVESFGTNRKPAPDTAPNRLVLETANSQTNPRFAVQVTADLRSAPQANPGGRPGVPSTHLVMANDVESLLPLALWSQVLLLVSVGGTVAARFWSRWPAYLCAAPIAIAALWNIYENLAGLLPNVY
jgi:sortase A